jgi:hypothetical protein
MKNYQTYINTQPTAKTINAIGPYTAAMQRMQAENVTEASMIEVQWTDKYGFFNNKVFLNCQLKNGYMEYIQG